MQQQGVTLLCPARLKTSDYQDEQWTLTLDSGAQIRSRLLVGADGANSQVRRLAGIGVSGWEYAQSCMLISVSCEQTPGDSTWQQFTPSGPGRFFRCMIIMRHWSGMTVLPVSASYPSYRWNN